MSARRNIITAVFLLFTVAAKAQHLPYTNQTDAGVLVGPASAASFTAQTFNGVRISTWKLEAGITTGVDIYPQMTILPISLGFKWNPFDNDISPFVSLNAGYGFGWLQAKRGDAKYDGGYILNPSLGIRIKTKNTAKVNLGIGFRHQKAVIRQRPEYYTFDYFGGGPPQIKEEYKFRRISVILGMSF